LCWYPQEERRGLEKPGEDKKDMKSPLVDGQLGGKWLQVYASRGLKNEEERTALEGYGCRPVPLEALKVKKIN
jgi:hypothetical protein